jgi:hypothetical protein
VLSLEGVLSELNVLWLLGVEAELSELLLLDSELNVLALLGELALDSELRVLKELLGLLRVD